MATCLLCDMEADFPPRVTVGRDLLEIEFSKRGNVARSKSGLAGTKSSQQYLGSVQDACTTAPDTQASYRRERVRIGRQNG
jgi:hypothetical protein